MANVTRTWIRENVQTLYGFGGQVTLDNFQEYLVGSGSIETTLTPAAVRGEIPILEKFHIMIPGLGWADCIPISEDMEMTDEEMLEFEREQRQSEIEHSELLDSCDPGNGMY